MDEGERGCSRSSSPTCQGAIGLINGSRISHIYLPPDEAPSIEKAVIQAV
jgi:hypothetical protein